MLLPRAAGDPDPAPGRARPAARADAAARRSAARGLGLAALAAGALLALLGLAAWPSATLRAQDPPTVRLAPARVTTAVSSTFTMDVEVEEVVDLAAFEVTVQFDPDRIHFEAARVGEFLSSTQRTILAFDPVELEPGKVLYQVISSGEAPGATGSGILAQLDFTARGEGQTLMSLPSVILVDSAQNAQELGGRLATIVIGPAPTATPATPATPVPESPELYLPFAYRERR